MTSTVTIKNGCHSSPFVGFAMLLIAIDLASVVFVVVVTGGSEAGILP